MAKEKREMRKISGKITQGCGWIYLIFGIIVVLAYFGVPGILFLLVLLAIRIVIEKVLKAKK